MRRCSPNNIGLGNTMKASARAFIIVENAPAISSGPSAGTSCSCSPKVRAASSISFTTFAVVCSPYAWGYKRAATRASPGTTSPSSCRKAVDEASADRIGNDHKHDGHAACRLQQRGCAVMAGGEDDIRRERNQFCRIGADAIGIGPCPTGLDLYVAPDGPARLLQALQKCPMSRLSQCIVGSTVMEHSDAPHALNLLHTRHERPSNRAAEQRDELAPPHCLNLPLQSRFTAHSACHRAAGESYGRT